MPWETGWQGVSAEGDPKTRSAHISVLLRETPVGARYLGERGVRGLSGELGLGDVGVGRAIQVWAVA